ncbi:hypothetical protein BA059_16815 [Mycolicibacterium sp. (ex Dasyatis americana)]|nr:hypothetical protein BA059_16815 [Mycolicibacterium sp. (ex Dasyatis americana)]
MSQPIDRSGLTGSPDWLQRFIEHTEKYAAQIGAGDIAADFMTDARMAWTRDEDRRHPDRPCAWCHHPRNSPECQFAANHTPIAEVFA